MLRRYLPGSKRARAQWAEIRAQPEPVPQNRFEFAFFLGVRAMSSTTGSDTNRRFIEFRKTPAEEMLSPGTVRWLAGLPPKARPRLLPIHFARITNALSGKWTARSECLSYLDDLLIDKRGSRCGFPLGVLLELAALKNYFETRLHPEPQTAWDQIAERPRNR